MNSIRAVGNINAIFKINLEEIENFREKMQFSFQTIFQQQKLILNEAVEKHILKYDNANVSFRTLVKGSYKNKIDEAGEINAKMLKLASKANFLELFVKPEEKSNDANLIMKSFKVNIKFIDKEILESIYSLDNNIKLSNTICNYEVEKESKKSGERNFINCNSKRCQTAHHRDTMKNKLKQLDNNSNRIVNYQNSFDLNNDIDKTEYFKGGLSTNKTKAEDISIHQNSQISNEHIKQAILNNKSQNKFESEINEFNTNKSNNSNKEKINSIPHYNKIHKKFPFLKNNFFQSSNYNHRTQSNVFKTNLVVEATKRSQAGGDSFHNLNSNNNNNNYNESAASALNKNPFLLKYKKDNQNQPAAPKAYLSNSYSNNIKSRSESNLNFYANSNPQINSNNVNNINNLKNVSTVSLKALKNFRRMRSVSHSININPNTSSKSMAFRADELEKNRGNSESYKPVDHWEIEKFPSNRDLIIEIRRNRKEKILNDHYYPLKHADKIRENAEIIKKKVLKKKKKRKEEFYEGNIIANFPRKVEQSYKSGRFSMPLAVLGD